MTLAEVAHLVWVNIMENKFKVVLTSIGIIVGAATIVLVIAVGRGGQMDVEDQFKNLNAASIEITTASPGSANRMGSVPGGGKPMDTIQLLGMEDRLRHKPSELSGNQQQRVAIARALVGNPSLLLADEPTGALDSSTSRDVLELFAKLHQRGHTIIMITHDLHVAENAKRVVHIVDGELFDQCPLDQAQ